MAEKLIDSGDWRTWQEAFIEEAQARKDIQFEQLCRYGVPALDDLLLAIAKDELVVIGADSGVGKSLLAIDIARHNAQRGKRVALYYLEGGYLEAMSRIKWKDLINEYYKYWTHLGIEINYRKWMFNYQQAPFLLELESSQYEKQKETYKENLLLYKPPKQGMSMGSLIKSLLDFHNLELDEKGKIDLDLIIIDHLQYFSLTRAESEIFEITEILRTVKTITDKFRVPVILISHLRKKTKDRGLPSQEDFYGSSNIPKIATTAITITPAIEKIDLINNIFPTYFRIAKSRIGLKPNYAILTNFNLNRYEYEDKYKICRLDNFGNVIEEAE